MLLSTTGIITSRSQTRSHWAQNSRRIEVLFTETTQPRSTTTLAQFQSFAMLCWAYEIRNTHKLAELLGCQHDRLPASFKARAGPSPNRDASARNSECAPLANGGPLKRYPVHETDHSPIRHHIQCSVTPPERNSTCGFSYSFQVPATCRLNTHRGNGTKIGHSLSEKFIPVPSHPVSFQFQLVESLG